MKKIKIVNIVGARPNFMKIAPVMREMKKILKFEPILIHTGQHYDREMSDIFFNELGLPIPDMYLGVGSGTHAEQTAKIMIELEKKFAEIKPDLVVVVGDVNSTIAATLVAVKLNIKVAHIEAGLRSFDRTMPEEINRIVTDALSEYLFTTCKDANKNLIKEGISRNKIFFVGNVMIDTLLLLEKKALKLEMLKKYQLQREKYALLTLHRPSNVDNLYSFKNILKALNKISKFLPVIFPVHPRTKKQIEVFKLDRFISCSNIKLINPIGYLEFLNLMINSKFVLTDSGGIQEETTVLNIPCITLRKNTERPITVVQGTNTVVGDDQDKILKEVNKILSGKYKKGKIPQYWDGKAAKRIVRIIKRKFL